MVYKCQREPGTSIFSHHPVTHSPPWDSQTQRACLFVTKYCYYTIIIASTALNLSEGEVHQQCGENAHNHASTGSNTCWISMEGPPKGHDNRYERRLDRKRSLPSFRRLHRPLHLLLNQNLPTIGEPQGHYDTVYHDLGDHRIARCRNTRLIVCSEAKAPFRSEGSTPLKTDPRKLFREEENCGGGRAATW